jgi:IS30 family transposase
LLVRTGKRCRPRKGAEAGAHLIPGCVDIDERPAHIEDKVEVGHWEGDTVYGQDSYLVTMVERVTKILLTCRVKTKTKKNVARAIKKMLKPFKHLCHTITFDNGGEFAGHQQIAKYLCCKVYFAKPYHSWQRGLNENTNGLLRRFFPKGMAIKSLPKTEIYQAQLLINMRPRKALNYLSPIEFLTGKRVSLIAAI